MPPLPRPNERDLVTLPPRPAIFGGRADVLVVGGGPAGLGAAYGAATAGARVILAERYGFLGGNATAALVMPREGPGGRRLGSTDDVDSPGAHPGPIRGGALPRASST